VRPARTFSVGGEYRQESKLLDTLTSNAQLIASILALISSVVAVAWNARTSRRVKTIELSYSFNKSRYDSLVAFHNAIAGKSAGSDTAARVKFAIGKVTQDELDDALISSVQSSVAVRDLYDENRHLFSKINRRQLDNMLHNAQKKEPSSREEKEDDQRVANYFVALSVVR
jgi:hypothetical protein